MIVVPLSYLLAFLTISFLFGFGVCLNLLVSAFDRRGLEGYTWLFVVLGVAVTILTVGSIIGWLNVIILFFAFTVSGTPMIVGAVIRHQVRIQKLIRRSLAGVGWTHDANQPK